MIGDLSDKPGCSFALVSVGEPYRDHHHGSDVREPGDGCPRQLDVAGIEVVEECAQRRQERPQHQDVGDESVGDRINHAKAEKEHIFLEPIP